MQNSAAAAWMLLVFAFERWRTVLRQLLNAVSEVGLGSLG